MSVISVKKTLYFNDYIGRAEKYGLYQVSKNNGLINYVFRVT